MFAINLIAAVASRMPYTVAKVRYFKHFRRWPGLKGDIRKFDRMVQYVFRHGLDNRDNPRWALMADKYAVREEIDRLLGEGHLVPLLGHWEKPEDIDFDVLPTSFILKTNNGCGTNIFIHDKGKIDREAIVARLKKSLSFPYPSLSGQLHYAHIPPCVVAEEILIQDGDHKSLTDYKIHCVNGEPQIIYVFTDRDEVRHFDFDMKAYTPEWIPVSPGQTPDTVRNQYNEGSSCLDTHKPEWIDDMLDMARRLAEGEEYVRIDFYHTNGRTIFGEMTYTPDTAFHSCYHPYQEAMRYLLDKIVDGLPSR